MLSNKLKYLSNSALASNPTSGDLNVAEYQTSNSMTPSSLPTITGETPQAPSKDIVLTSLSC
jgi:hypothetical protein